MPGRLSDLKEKWLPLTCPACRTKMRIREAYAHLKGRCPECGYRLAPPRPQPASPIEFSDADEPLGLMPVEEEWPEPARVEKDEEDQGSTYTVADPHLLPPLPKPIGLDDDELYHLAMAGSDRSPPVDPSARAEKKGPYEFHPPAGPDTATELPITYRLSAAELNPLRPPEPPPWPLVQGIYSFPLRGDSLGLWLALSLKFGIIAALTGLLLHFIDVWQTSSTETRYLGILVPPLVMVISVVSLWVGAYAAVQFLCVLEDTAAGNDRVPRPEWTVAEGIMKCVFVLWVAACSTVCSLVPGLPLVMIAGRLLPEGIAPSLMMLIPATLLFPVLLLSSLAAPSPWMLLDKRFLSRFLAKPAAVLALTLPSFALLVPCVLVGTYAFRHFNLLAAFLSGFLWSACFLIYARLLGRVAWYATLRVPKKTVKRKKQEDPDDADET